MSKALHRTGGRRSILDWWGSADQHENAIMFGGGFVWLIYFGDAYPLTQRAERTPEGLPLLLLCPTNVAQLAHLRLVKLATFLPFLATLLLLFVLLSLLFLLALFFLVLFFLSLPTLLSFPVLLALFSLPLAPAPSLPASWALSLSPSPSLCPCSSSRSLSRPPVSLRSRARWPEGVRFRA